MSGIMCAFVGSAAAALNESHTLTTGNAGVVGSRIRGYNSGSSTGSLSPTATVIGGATQILALYYDESVPQYYLQVNGGTNSGWTTMTIDGLYAYNRSAATYDSASKSWSWFTSDTISTQVFGAASSTHSVVFT